MKRWLTAAAMMVCGFVALAALPSDALLERLKPNGFVNDFANVLSAKERDALEQRLVDLKQKTGAEVAIVTLNSLEGGDDFDVAEKLFTKWGFGQKNKNNGLLL